MRVTWVGGTHDAEEGRLQMSDTPTRDAKLVQFLNEAYAKEKQLETALAAHLEVTIRNDYAKRLKAVSYTHLTLPTILRV